MEKAAVLWTGGKDSALALFESFNRFSVDRLVTFVPEPRRRFYAHPVRLLQAQAESTGLPHHLVAIKEPFNDSYRRALSGLADDGIDTVISGDIAPVDGNPNWIRACAQDVIEVHTPLWEAGRMDILDTLMSNRFNIVCSLACKRSFPSTIAGRCLDSRLISELCRLHESSGLDVCGENGEYHTWVTCAPFFQKPLEFTGLRLKETEEFFYLSFSRVGLGRRK